MIEAVAADDESKISIGMLILQHPDRLDGVGDALALHFEVTDPEMGIGLHDAPSHFEPVLDGHQLVIGLVGGGGIGNPPHLGQVELIADDLGDDEMGDVGRIEGAPEKTDVHDSLGEPAPSA